MTLFHIRFQNDGRGGGNGYNDDVNDDDGGDNDYDGDSVRLIFLAMSVLSVSIQCVFSNNKGLSICCV